MADLYQSLLLMFVLCCTAIIVGATAADRFSPRRSRQVQLLLTALMMAYMLWLWDRPLMAQLLPASGVIVLGNWLPVFGCCFAGFCLKTRSILPWRRVLMSTAIISLGAYSLVRPLLGQPPRCYPQYLSGVVQFQTDDGSCSAASAASVLRMCGIQTSESEMAQLCLTRRGTHWMGVFRGLKLKLAGTPWDVVAEDFRPARHLAESQAIPGVLSLTFVSAGGPGFTASGFVGVTGHSVVTIRSTADRQLKVFDPSPEYAFETWNQEFLKDIRSGVLLRIVPRHEALSEPTTGHTLLVDVESVERGLALR